MKTRKFKCLIRMGRGGTIWKVIESTNVIAARAEFESLYGKSNMKSGIISAN